MKLLVCCICIYFFHHCQKEWRLQVLLPLKLKVSLRTVSCNTFISTIQFNVALIWVTISLVLVEHFQPCCCSISSSRKTQTLLPSVPEHFFFLLVLLQRHSQPPQLTHYHTSKTPRNWQWPTRSLRLLSVWFYCCVCVNWVKSWAVKWHVSSVLTA